MLSLILKNRLRETLQQRHGIAYEPQVKHSLSELKKRGSISAEILSESKYLEDVGNVTMQIADEMAQNGVTQQEREEAIQASLISLRRARETNEFWVDWLYNCQSRPERQKWDLHKEDTYQSIQVSDLNALAKKYLKKKSAICCLSKPEAPKQEKTKK